MPHSSSNQSKSIPPNVSQGTALPPEATAQVIADMQRWLERAVIGLNLCPFAKSVHVKGQIRYAVSAATSEGELLKDLARELIGLADADPEQCDTTLLMAPCMLEDFLDFNDFLGAADELLEKLGLAGVLQIADFHPRYQFADTEEGEISNYTNRAPYPTLHLLREESIDRAVEAFPEAEAIFERNIEVLQELGQPGWDALEIHGHYKPGQQKGQ